MAFINCPNCGHVISDIATMCAHCGQTRGGSGTASSPDPVVSPLTGGASPVNDNGMPLPVTASFPLFPVATHKFIVMSIFSFGIYELYWFYQNWTRLKAASGERLSPIWRAIFAPLWGFSLFKQVKATADSNGVFTGWDAGVLGAFYFILSILWRLPDPWGLISLVSWLPLIPVQHAAERINDRYASSVAEDRNENYTPVNVAVIVIGSLLILLIVMGMFIPKKSYGS